jgi:hypothetical protein
MRIARDDQLRAVWTRGVDVGPPGLTEVITRRPLASVGDETEDRALADQIRKQDVELIRGGLEKAGISKATTERLRAFDEFAPNAGRFLAASLDMSHKMMVLLNVSLMEEAEHIRTVYLRDETLDHELRIEWQKCYTDIVEIIGKGYDRTVSGAGMLAKITAARAKAAPGKEVKKVGFTPLTK